MTFKEYRETLEQRLHSSINVIRHHIENGDEQSLSYVIGERRALEQIIGELDQVDLGEPKHAKQ